MHLVFERADGTATAVPVNGLSTVQIRTWSPPVFGDGGVAPLLVEDQTVALNDIVTVTLADEAGGAEVLASVVGGVPEQISELEAARLEAQFETAPAPWDEDA